MRVGAQGRRSRVALRHRNTGTLFVALLFLFTIMPTTGSTAGAADTTGAWSADVTLMAPDGWYEAPVHAALLPDGRVMMFGVGRETWPSTDGTHWRRAAWVVTPTPLGTALPASTVPLQVTEPVDIDQGTYNGLIVKDDLFCAGTTLTADGKVFVAGGTRAYIVPSTGAPAVTLGLTYETMFDPKSNVWSRLPGSMVGVGATGTSGRWYPTVTRLPNGKILVVGGFDRIIGGPAYNFSTEIWDPTTRTQVLAAPFGKVPKQIVDGDYTHEWMLPYPSATMDMLFIGQDDIPVLGSSRAPTLWNISNPLRPNGATDTAG